MTCVVRRLGLGVRGVEFWFGSDACFQSYWGTRVPDCCCGGWWFQVEIFPALEPLARHLTSNIASWAKHRVQELELSVARSKV